VALLGGFAVAFDNPARRAFVVEMVSSDDQVNNAVSLNSALMTLSRVIGPAVAGLLVTTVGFGWTFAFDGISYLAVILGLWLIDPAQLRRPPVAEKGQGQVREGIRYARSIPELWVPLIMTAVVGTLAFNFQTVLPLFAVRDLHGSDLTYTLLMSVVSVGSVAGALFAARRKLITIRTVSAAALAFGASMLLLMIARGDAMAFGFGVLMGFGSILFLTASTSIVQIESAPAMRGRVLALQSMVLLGSTPIGAAIVGAIADHFGARYSIGLGAVATLAAGAFGLLTIRRSTGPHPSPPELIPAVPEPAVL
jgi:predicted MFS family arabinose efflux permease